MNPPLPSAEVMKTPPPPGGDAGGPIRRSNRSRWMLVLLIAVCVAPVIASYLAYYVFPPSDRTNYGDLIEPQRPVPAAPARVVQQGVDPSEAPGAPVGGPVTGPGSGAGPDGASLADAGLAAFGGRWVLVAVDSGSCELACAEKLFFMRQTHVAMGRERPRVVRVLLVTDDRPLPAPVLGAHPDLTVLRVDAGALAALFPVSAQGALTNHIFVVDPLRNLMMRFPASPDPAKVRKDLQKLLKASRIG